MCRCRTWVVFLVCLAVCVLMPMACDASGAEMDLMLDKQLEMMDFGEVDAVIRGSSYGGVRGVDFPTLVGQAVRGEVDLSPQGIGMSVLQSLFGEASALLSMMRHMILIAVLGAVFRELSASFQRKAVSELGFYAHYLVILSILLSSFSMCVGLVQALSGELCAFMMAAQPLLVGVVSIGGQPAAAFAFAPVLLAATNTVAFVVQEAIVPVITLAAALQVVNYLSERPMLEKLSGLLRDGIRWALRGMAVLFVSVLSIQRMSAPAVQTAAAKTAKLAVNMVPVVGTALTDTVDSVMAWAGVARSGVMVAAVVVLALMCAAPLLEMAAFVLIYKLTASLIQPVADARVVKVIDATGAFAGLLLGASALVAVMFIFMVMIVLSV